jgi:hypothetical protein
MGPLGVALSTTYSTAQLLFGPTTLLSVMTMLDLPSAWHNSAFDAHVPWTAFGKLLCRTSAFAACDAQMGKIASRMAMRMAFTSTLIDMLRKRRPTDNGLLPIVGWSVCRSWSRIISAAAIPRGPERMLTFKLLWDSAFDGIFRHSSKNSSQVSWLQRKIWSSGSDLPSFADYCDGSEEQANHLKDNNISPDAKDEGRFASGAKPHGG